MMLCRVEAQKSKNSFLRTLVLMLALDLSNSSHIPLKFQGPTPNKY